MFAISVQAWLFYLCTNLDLKARRLKGFIYYIRRASDYKEDKKSRNQAIL